MVEARYRSPLYKQSRLLMDGARPASALLIWPTIGRLRRPHGLDDSVRDRQIQVRSYGETQDGSRQPFGDGEILLFPAGACVTARQMGRDRIMNQRLDACGAERIAQTIPLQMADDKKVPA